MVNAFLASSCVVCDISIKSRPIHVLSGSILYINVTSILMPNMKVAKIVQNTFYAHFEGFWSPSYVISKLTSICVNLIMSIYFFL